MVMMQGRVAAEFDGAAATLLASAVTQAGADRDVNTAVALDRLNAAYWDSNEQTLGWFAVNIDITSITSTGDNDLFTFNLEVYTSTDFGSARTEIASLVLTSAMLGGVDPAVGSGFVRMACDAKTFQKQLASATHMALSCTKGDATCSVTYSAWLSHLKAN